MKQAAVTKKPALNTDAALKFASQEAPQAAKKARGISGHRQAAKSVKAVSGLVPDGDVRLTSNIRQDLHLKLKIAAAERRTTIGEIIEELVKRYL